MTKFILEYLFIFITGAQLGWGIEVVYRKYFGLAKKWINPGFLSGPYLPLYGTGVSLLYIVSEQHLSLGIKIVLFAIITTTIEYMTGLFFLKFYHTRLWDYSKLKFNIKGFIAPLYTLFWTILSLFFYFVLYPYFYSQVQFLYGHLEFSLFIGVFYGVILVDIINSFKVVNRFRKIMLMAEESKIAINYERFKLELRERFEELSDRVESFEYRIEEIGQRVEKMRVTRKPTFFLPFTGDYNMRVQVQNHLKKAQEERLEKIKNALNR
jgi:uncharacterized membrane protein